ncbi:GGDEF domain-containing protein [Thiosulfativibrio zosterae]|uniref:diguanylate cyclase n=1 Tax=Thiosulfativibrio zosterae TaxID=2675053 RepID=A0A6F8PQV5_9GAMM|nr:GGDEF domain-containing protein [Thiosulfativibrio zosterae]BBP44370.1 GGDEF domain-containing protein [Thiosulfativibrio zosterae]
MSFPAATYLSKLGHLHQNTFINARQTFIVYQAILAAASIFPFAIWRFLTGDWQHGLIDLLIVAVLAFLGVLARQPQQLERIIWSLSILYIIAVWTVVYFFGEQTLYWGIVVGMATHFVLPTRSALVMNAILLLGTLALAHEHPFAELFTFSIIYTLVIILASQFSWRMNQDNRNLLFLAHKDILTGAGNRLALDQKINDIFKEPQTTPWTLMMVDIDHFKNINDQYGHSVGDEALVQLVLTMQQNCQHPEWVFRYGGEEFCLLLPQSLAQSLVLADKLRQTIQTTQLIAQKTITISIGLAERQDAENPHDWLIKADSALYKAKKAGRNQVCLHHPNES